MKRLYYTLTLLVCFCFSCQDKQKQTKLQNTQEISTQNVKTIIVETESKDFEKLGNYLKATSYVQLASEPLVSDITEIQIKNDRIYLQDKLNRIICYDMQGNVIFQIDAVGNGPGEYVNINAFAVNEKNRELVIYDNLRSMLLYYNSDNGKYFKTEKFPKPNPSAMASTDGVYYYDNQHHNNYPNDSILHYSLFVSRNGIDMEQHYFPHNQAEADYHFQVTPYPFSYNNASVYYCKNFDNIVYELSPSGLKALYEIKLPNPLPFAKIKEKANEQELIKSEYSFGIESIYQCENLLYFQFTQNGHIQFVLYDLSTQKQIYCGRKMEDKTGKNIPIHRLICGTYDNHFWGYLTPEAIDWTLSNEPNKEYPELLRNYNSDTDNPIIVFYEVLK